MATNYTNRTVKLYSKGGAAFAFCEAVVPPNEISKNLSEIILEQNKKSSFTSQKYIEQEFYFPENYIRVDKSPDLTGFQFYVNANKNSVIKYKLYRYNDSFKHRFVTDTRINNVTPGSPSTDYVTYTTELPHYLEAGDTITIEGFNTSGYNGFFVVDSVLNATQFSVSNDTTGVSTYTYAKISTPPIKSVTAENGQTYVRTVNLTEDKYVSSKFKLIKIDKKKKILKFTTRHVFEGKIKFPKGSILIENNRDNPLLIKKLFNDEKVFRHEIIKSHVKKEKRKKMVKVILNQETKSDGDISVTSVGYMYKPKYYDIYRTVIYTNLTIDQMSDSKSFDSNVKQYGGKNFKKWIIIQRNRFKNMKWEIWTPYKSKKEIITVKTTNKDFTGEVNYKEPLDIDERFDSPAGWTGVCEGLVIAKGDGDQWVDAKFSPEVVDPDWVNQKFKIVIEGDYNLNKIYYCTPSAFLKEANAYKKDGQPLVSRDTSSIMMRVLAAVANEGTDFLSNKFRSTIEKFEANSVGDDSNEFWSSKPNPSKYGVENIYFDVSSVNNNSNVIDSIYLNAITPGVTFNIYYSNETLGENLIINTEEDLVNAWDDLLWTWVPKTFKANKAQSYALPFPITAKSIKIEFSSLQATYYNPGSHDKLIFYKKHPTWVVNYFLSIHNLYANQIEDAIPSDQTLITYDLFKLAFNYYKGDIVNTPNGPIVIEDDNSQNGIVTSLLKNAASDLEGYDSFSLNNINAAFDKFRSHPGLYTNRSTTVGDAAAKKSIEEFFNYSVESLSLARGRTEVVSTTNRNHLMLEKQMPAMYFYPTCRHKYKKAYARFETNKAYFVKIKEIRFERNNHNIISDKQIYKFVPGDTTNYEHSDFISSANKWSIT